MNCLNQKEIKMKCNCLNSDLILYAEGSLPPERSDDLESHIAECSECHEFLSFLMKSMTLVESDKETAQNPFLYTRIIAKLEADEKQSWFQLKRVIPALAFSTILIAGVMAGINIGKLYSANSAYSNDLQEEISYIDDIKQESIETFFLTSNDEEDE